MAINFATLIYDPVFDIFSIPVTFYPIASQPGGPTYPARGIFDTRSVDVIGEDGSLISDQRTILDILEKEFSTMPQQNDCVDIPFDCNGKAIGMMEVTDASSNGGGETTLTLKRWVA